MRLLGCSGWLVRCCYVVASMNFDSWSLNSLGSSEHSINVSLWDFYDF